MENKIKLCCSSPMTPGDTLTQKANNLRSWGYDALAVFHPFAKWNDDVHEELLTLRERTGIIPAEFVLMDPVYGHAMSDNLELRESCRSMYFEAAQVCSELGAVTEIEFEYKLQDPMPLFDPYQQLTEKQKNEFISFYLQMLKIVEGSDGRVLLEPLNRYESKYLNRVSDNLEIIDRVAHPNAGLLPDLFHMSVEESDIPAVLRLAGNRISHVHLGDSNRLLPGSGNLNWPNIFSALLDVGFNGYLNLECSNEGKPESTLPATAIYLRKLIAS